MDAATASEGAPSVNRVLVATDRSQSADRAVRWAATLAKAHQAELLLLQVLAPLSQNGASPPESDERVPQTTEALRRFADEIAGARGRALVVIDDEPAQAILDAIDEQAVDVVVLGNAGMAGRKEFLLGNIPNRVSHAAHCSVVIVNTAVADGAAQASPPRRRMSGEPEQVEGQLLARALRIGRVMTRLGLREFLNRPNVKDEDAVRETARRFRDALDELGPTFAKLGQILSTRPDLLPPAFIEELATLQDRVTPLTEAEVVKVMEQELGVPWEDVFSSIDPHPLAAGTIAQVHRAALENGDRVVVKVQRPNAEADILQDLGLMEMFAQRAGERPAFRQVFDIPAMIEHLSSSLRRELDFRIEAGNLKRMREVLAPFSSLAVPDVYENLSTSRLLVMQEIQGVPVREAPPSAARDEAARQLLEGYYQQVLAEGFFHADPHPGNMKWWNDSIYFLDLGMVGEVDTETRELVLLLLLAFAQKDGQFLTEITLKLAGGNQPGTNIDVAAFQADMEALIERYRDRPLREIQLGPALQEVTQISVSHNVRVPASLMLMGKAFAQMQLVAAEMDPTLDPFSVAESFVLRNTLRQVTDRLSPQALFYESQKIRVRLMRVLEGIEGVIGARPGNDLQVHFQGSERLEESIAQAGRRLSLSFGLSGALAVTAMTANSRTVPKWVPAVTSGISSVLAAGLLVDRARRR